MTTYLESLPEKKFVPNIVVRLLGEYFSIRQPDRGLVVDDDKNGLVATVTVNPTAIDPFRATTTISNYSLRLLDKFEAITVLFDANPQYFQGELVEIWLGRVGVGMDFADYLQLPDTFVAKVSKQDASYTFTTREQRDRLSTGAFNTQGKLGVSIFAATTVITLQSTASFPTFGLMKVDDEIISWTGISGNNLTGCIRGEEGSVPADHDLGAIAYLVEAVEENPVTLLLQLLISSGGGGPYDVLSDGASIDQAMIDIAQIEGIRDTFFSSRTFRFLIYGLDSLKQFIEDEVLFPLGIRLRANSNGLIGLALLDRTEFVIDVPILDHDEITKAPDYDIDDTKINNQLRIQWDYDDATGLYKRVSEFSDSDSIAEFGEKDWFEMNFKGIREDLDGEDVVNDIQLLFFGRFSFPKPNIQANTHISSSYLQLGDHPDLLTTRLPNSDGELNFGDSLEVISRALNLATGDVRFQLAFTSFTGVRQCYIAPSDIVQSFSDQKTVTFGAGRGDLYRAGWFMRLYDESIPEYASLQINEIASVVGDVVTFVNNWTTPLIALTHRIKFADYDDVTAQQKRFCFMSSVGGGDFPDGGHTYRINFG